MSPSSRPRHSWRDEPQAPGASGDVWPEPRYVPEHQAPDAVPRARVREVSTGTGDTRTDQPPVLPASAPEDREFVEPAPATFEGEDVADEPVEHVGEPVMIEKGVTLLLGALVGLGWITIPNPAIASIATAAAAVISLTASVLVRSRVRAKRY